MKWLRALRNSLHLRGWDHPQISILIPFRGDAGHRDVVLAWVRRFWLTHLTDVEIIIGEDVGVPFSKASAVNHAAQRARGRIFVVLDADAIMDPEIVQRCADRLDAAATPLWFVPYLRLYRFTQAATMTKLGTDPQAAYAMTSPPPADDVLPTGKDYGHQFGALILIMPAAAFALVGGMDPRFRGWGGEDGSFMRALDTMYALHETTDNDVLHLWHAHPGGGYLRRRWIGQRMPNANSRLAQRYALSTGDPTLMRALLAERTELRHVKPLTPNVETAWID